MPVLPVSRRVGRRRKGEKVIRMLKEELDRGSARAWPRVGKPAAKGDGSDVARMVPSKAGRRRLYVRSLVLAACVGVCLGLVVSGVRYVTGDESRASAVISFQYEGIEDGLDPNGASFDINKIKSPEVIEAALAKLGMEDVPIEEVRRNIVIGGVIPEDALQRITSVRKMALDNASYYDKIADVSYFPSQYVVHLYRAGGLSPAEMTEVLDGILDSYRDYFLDTYADTEVLTVTSRRVDYTEYDYVEAVEMLRTQIGIMTGYVSQRREQAPDFRASGTGLAFGDIEAALQTIEDIELSKLDSYIESVALTKDKEIFGEQYNYRIRKYNMDLAELQVRLAIVEDTIDTYMKDPVVIVSSQESTQEISQKTPFYDNLVERMLSLNGKIASINTALNEAYELLNRINSNNEKNTQEQYDYADALLGKVVATLAEWVELTEETTEEYYSTVVFPNACKVAEPAGYQAGGGLVELAKPAVVCAAALVCAVLVAWCVDGFGRELKSVKENRGRGK